MAGLKWTPRDMKGMTVIVTGANSGIGKETAHALAGMGVSKLIMACRNQEKGESARDEIASNTGNQGVVVKILDLGSMASVRAFAEDVLASEERLDVLVNNAGMLAPTPRQVTPDGFELCIATNHLGHHLLTSLLLPLLRKSAPARVVVVSSTMYKYGKLDLTDLQSEKSYGVTAVYSQSKIANILFTKELAKKLEGSGVTVNALHPGVVATNIVGENPVGFWTRAFFFVARPFTKSASQGAATSIYLSAAQEIEGVSGEFFDNCRKVGVSAALEDVDLARKLWEESDRLTGVQPKVSPPQ